MDFMTTEWYRNTTERPLQSFPLFIAQVYLWKILAPFIILPGIFGNVMIIVIMKRTAAAGESTIHLYFIAIAVFDLIYLFTGTLEHWVDFTFGLSISATHTVVCKLFVWLYTGSSTVSCWCLVGMTVHRTVSVVLPHRVGSLCTRRTVLTTLTTAVAFFALLYSHYFIGVDTVLDTSRNSYKCTQRNDDENYIYFFEIVFVYIELSLYCLLPFVILVASNTVLVWKLSGSVTTINRTLTQGHSEKVQAREKAANSVTLTVIIVTLAFIVLTLPSSVNFVVNFLVLTHSRDSGHRVVKRVFTAAICNLLAQVNSAVNFYLYCLTGRRFREEFIKVMCCGRNRGQRRGASYVTEVAAERCARA